MTPYAPSLTEHAWKTIVEQTVQPRKAQLGDSSWKSLCVHVNRSFARVASEHSSWVGSPPSPIEPLVGFLRSPLFTQAVCDKPDSFSFINDRSHLKLLSRRKAASAMLLDVGAGFGPGGSSIRWMQEAYASRGVHAHAIFAWEANAVENHSALLSPTVTPRPHVFEIRGALDADGKDLFRVLRENQNKFQVNVLKLDIDDSELEWKIVSKLLSSRLRIDELFWEHHFRVATPMWAKGWHLSKSSPLTDRATLSDSYKVFTRLRRKGIRAHSWI